MALVKGNQYVVNGTAGMIYKFSTMVRQGRVAQHWFFHVDSYLTASLLEHELEKFAVPA